MVRNERVSLLISTYNWPEALELSLYSLSKQSVLPDEVIIADNGSTSDTAEAIKRAAKYLPVPVKHIWQEDKGFRKSLILNKGVKAATGDYIIQIDGDIVMDRHFIEDHVSVMKRGYFIRGSRSMLNENTTRKLIYKFKSGQFENARIKGDKNRFNSMRIKLLSKLIKYLKSDVRGVKGCNVAYWKDDFIKVNGYNNAMQGWGHEDMEFACRMHNAGVKMRRLKFRAVVYHLFHEYYSRNNAVRNKELAMKIYSDSVSYAIDGYMQS